MTRVYLDHNATTPMRPEVRAHLLETLDRIAGNPSSVHRSGRAARQTLDEARERTAAALGVHEDEITFTSGGTEAANLAILGAVRALPRGEGLVTTAVEHSCVLGAADLLESEGRPVERLPVDRQGRPDEARLIARAREPACGLLSAMAANNEVGTLLRLERIGAALADLGPRRPLYHTDAVQALGRIPVRIAEWRVDMASFSAHKVGGPLGVGVLWRRRGTPLVPMMMGGGQESGARPGSENVPAISAASVAIELATSEQPAFHSRVRDLALTLWREIHAALPEVELAGPPIDADDRLPNTLNLSVRGIDGRMLVARLDLEGLEVSAGSACASGSLEPSHVLLAMGFESERARSALRVSLGRTTTRDDIHTAVDILRRTLAVDDATRDNARSGEVP